MNQTEVLQKFKKGSWEMRVRRPGFYQSKQIVVEAETQKVELTKSISVQDPSNIIVKDIFIYNKAMVDQLTLAVFPQAFKEDRDWPLKVIEQLDFSVSTAQELIKVFNTTEWPKAAQKEKIKTFQGYVATLFDIQKYYCIAVPLTNFCEKKIRSVDESLIEYAVQYKALDVDRMNESLLRIKKSSGLEERKNLIAEHLNRFGWIKTNYNIVEPYTEVDVLAELNSDIHAFEPKGLPDSEHKYLVAGLQSGIYLRNRMKEFSQQIWFAYEALARQLARDLGIIREDFLQLHYKEVLSSLEQGKLVLPLATLKSRHDGFFAGIIDNEEFIFTGPIVEEVSRLFDEVSNYQVKEVRGNVASKGLVIGVVKIVPRIADLGKLEEGDILVTSMTTPDFIVAMKKAGAIITDEGGLSCHAAIVSRELRKPCIIGTKIATKVLKDGMRVEVDANNGVVRILS